MRVLGGAHVAFAARRPELFCLMSGPYGLYQIMPLPPTTTGRSAGQILNGLLDDMVTQDHMSAPLRDGALLRVWSAIHGIAFLAPDSLEGLETQTKRDMALHGLMGFNLKGHCDRRSCLRKPTRFTRIVSEKVRPQSRALRHLPL